MIRGRRAIRLLAIPTLILGGVWGVTLTTLYLGQQGMMYPVRGGPTRMRRGWSRIPLPAADGSTYLAFHHPAATGMPTVIFLHGNATTYPSDVVATRGFVERGAGVLVPEYPGYSGSPGEPTQASINEQADRAYDWLRAQGVQPGDIIIYGNSIGAGPAVHLALRPHALLTLVSPVGSMTALVRQRMRYVPTALVRDKWENAAEARAVRGPAIVMHAADDGVVPVAQGRQLAQALGTRLVEFRHGGHAICFDPAIAQMVAIDSLYVWRTGNDGTAGGTER